MNTTQIKNCGAVTAQYDFLPATSGGEKLFSVRAGIPLSSAFDQLSILIGSSGATVEFAASSLNEDANKSALWSVKHLLDFAHALVQSMHQGHNAHASGTQGDQC